MLLAVWAVSALLAPVQFQEPDPRPIVREAAGYVTAAAPLRVVNPLAPAARVQFLARMVKTFVEFPPLGVVLVALLGVGVAEHTGFITAGLKVLLQVTPRRLLTPALLLAAIISHSAADCGFVLVVPLGGLLFAAAGRPPVAGICCAFAGVSGGYSASFLPPPLDPLRQSFTQHAAQRVEPGRLVSPLANGYFTSASAAKWAQLGLPPELTQAAFRVGSSSTTIITPLMTYFPLVVVFCQRYVRQTGIGTLVTLMRPYSLAFLALGTALLLG